MVARCRAADSSSLHSIKPLRPHLEAVPVQLGSSQNHGGYETDIKEESGGKGLDTGLV